MSFELHGYWALLSVKVIDIDLPLGYCSSKQMASIRKFNLCAVLNLKSWLVLFETIRKHIHKLNFVLEGYDKLKPTGMECNN
jgi:hypothetical protein